jgi:hypothetical protein
MAVLRYVSVESQRVRILRSTAVGREFAEADAPLRKR